MSQQRQPYDATAAWFAAAMAAIAFAPLFLLEVIGVWFAAAMGWIEFNTLALLPMAIVGPTLGAVAMALLWWAFTLPIAFALGWWERLTTRTALLPAATYPVATVIGWAAWSNSMADAKDLFLALAIPASVGTAATFWMAFRWTERGSGGTPSGTKGVAEQHSTIAAVSPRPSRWSGRATRIANLGAG